MLMVLLVGHGVILYYVVSHVSLSAAGLSVAIVLLLIKHMGLFSRVHALFQRGHSRNRPL
jgi:hypothetical protein